MYLLKHGAKTGVVIFQETGSAVSMLITTTTVWRFCVNFWLIFGHFGKEIFFSQRIGKIEENTKY